MARIHRDRFRATLQADITTTGQDTITLSAVPVIGATDQLLLCIEDDWATPLVYEYVLITGSDISGNTISNVVRDYQSTGAQTFSTGAAITAVLVADIIDGKEDKAALGSAAYTPTTDYATAAQGALADDLETLFWQGI